MEGGSGAGQATPTPAAALRVEEGQKRDHAAAMLDRMRSRLLQRIHLAILRVSERVQRAPQRHKQQQQQRGEGGGNVGAGLSILSDGEQEEDDETGGGSSGQEMDGGAVLQMAALRVSLSVLKAVKGSSPEIFADFCESLLGLFQVRMVELKCDPTRSECDRPAYLIRLLPSFQASPPAALAQIQRHRAQRETLEQIRDFARGVILARPTVTALLSTAPSAVAAAQKEREHALALLFGLGVARGSVHDLVEVAALLASAGKDVPRLSHTPATRLFWQRLTSYAHRYHLAMVNPFEPDGPDILVQQAPAGVGAAAPAAASTASMDRGQGEVRLYDDWLSDVMWRSDQVDLTDWFLCIYRTHATTRPLLPPPPPSPATGPTSTFGTRRRACCPR